MKPPWYFDEFIQTGTDFTDIDKVEAYDNKMCKFRNYKQEAAMVLDLFNVQNTDVLLEIGTGTGHFAIEAAKRCGRVHAVDVSETMLKYAEFKALQENVTNIEWSHSGFLSTDFPDAHFDCIFTNAAMHHLPDFWKALALRNIHRMLKPGGKFILGDVIFSCAIDETEAKVQDWIEGVKKVDDEFDDESAGHIKKEYSTFSWIIEGMLDRTGFDHKIVIDSNNFIVYLCTKK
jgi:ubiquinone/menaquinone biosynthesis C-methylase UbiE